MRKAGWLHPTLAVRWVLKYNNDMCSAAPPTPHPPISVFTFKCPLLPSPLMLLVVLFWGLHFMSPLEGIASVFLVRVEECSFEELQFPASPAHALSVPNVTIPLCWQQQQQQKEKQNLLTAGLFCIRICTRLDICIWPSVDVCGWNSTSGPLFVCLFGCLLMLIFAPRLHYKSNITELLSKELSKL